MGKCNRGAVRALSWLALSLACSAQTPGEEAERVREPLPEGAAGIAADYPGDAGIAGDPRVVFVEDFEVDELQQVLARWDDAKNPEGLAFDEVVPPGSGGKQSLRVRHVGGGGTGSHLYRRLERAPEEGGPAQGGHERLFCRMLVRFDEDCAPVHHFGTNLGGHVPATRWPMVSAGEPPPGDKSFWVGIEPFGKRWVWDTYAYWHEMRGSPPAGQTWGNCLIRDDELEVTRGRWQCIEFMVALNQPGKFDGELAVWIDGELVSHLGEGFPRGTWVFDKFTPGSKTEGIRWNQELGDRENLPGDQPFEGFSWRTDEALDINWLWLYLYITRAPEGHESHVWFDHVVVATEYIGPITAK